jgi:hypothetical protein
MSIVFLVSVPLFPELQLHYGSQSHATRLSLPGCVLSYIVARQLDVLHISDFLIIATLTIKVAN